MRNDRGYTYLITNGREYKIGITTKTPQCRVAELQTGSPTKITISGYSYNSNALAMEIELHRKFASKRLEGEWFALTDDDVAIIHHHFETNHLDEYFAPLSTKAVEIKRKEKEREAERKRQWKLAAPKRKTEKEERLAKKREHELIDKEDAYVKAKDKEYHLEWLRAEYQAKQVARREGKIISKEEKELKERISNTKGVFIGADVLYQELENKKRLEMKKKDIEHEKERKKRLLKYRDEYRQLNSVSHKVPELALQKKREEDKYQTYSTGIHVKDGLGNKILKPIEEEKKQKEEKRKKDERNLALQKKREEDKYQTYSTGVHVKDSLGNKILKPIVNAKEEAKKDNVLRVIISMIFIVAGGIGLLTTSGWLFLLSFFIVIISVGILLAEGETVKKEKKARSNKWTNNAFGKWSGGGRNKNRTWNDNTQIRRKNGRFG